MHRFVKRFLDEEDGVTAIECGLIGLAVAVAIIVCVHVFRAPLRVFFSLVGGALSHVVR